MKKFIKSVVTLQAVLLGLVLIVSGCGSDSVAVNASGSAVETSSAEISLRQALDLVSTDMDFSLLVEAQDGSRLEYDREGSTAESLYRSASTSKMVTAAVILWLVDQGYLQLSDHPQDYIGFWPNSGNAAKIELRHLLSFTSGITEEPFCVNNPFADFSDCVASILAATSNPAEPGTTFYYSSTHLQIAGLMAIKALGVSSWAQVFDFFKQQTQLFPNSVYDLPSTSNPRLAGGMHWQARDYLDFLDRLYFGNLLSSDRFSAMTSDQSGTATVVYSPISSWSSDVDWHYGLGGWIECSRVPFDCTDTPRFSSLGAYGAYPFIDFNHHYVGIVAREGTLGTAQQGFSIWRQVEVELNQWADEKR